MERVCFQLQVKPECIEEYSRRHAAVWPEMLESLAAAGWQNYSLFLRDDGLLIGYFETDDLAAALDGMAQTEVNGRWQAEMGPMFAGLEGFAELEGSPDTDFLRLAEVFNLDDQLRGIRGLG